MCPAEYVMVVHVPVAKGECVLIPAADLDDRERFAWWSRVWFQDDIFANEGWREQAQRLFAAERAACARGDAATAAKLVVAFPQALEFPEVRLRLQSLAWTYDPSGFTVIASAVRKASPFKKHLSAESKEARDILALGLGKILTSGTSSIDAAFKAATGEAVVEGGTTRTLRALYEKLEARRRDAYPRVIRVSRACGDHGGWLQAEVPADEAPRLILTEREGRSEQRKSFPVLPVDLMSFREPTGESADPGFEPPLPSIQKATRRRARHAASMTRGSARRRRTRR